MPSANYFRVCIVSEKPTIELSAFHLYDDNNRVDQNATITTRIDNLTGDISSLSIDNPTDSSGIKFNTPLVFLTRRNITYNFSTLTNVNAFRIGTGSNETTFADEFMLQYSDDGFNYITFINVSLSKKMSYPGPYQLTDLKPVGQCYPLVLPRELTVNTANTGLAPILGDDQRSFIGVGTDTYQDANIAYNTPACMYQWNVPGWFSKGKYYFEVYKESSNKATANGAIVDGIQDVVWYYPGLCFFDQQSGNNKERDTTGTRNVSSINTLFPKCAYLVNGAQTAAWTNVNQLTQANYNFKPGFQNGIFIDLDAGAITVISPSYYNNTNIVIPDSSIKMVNMVSFAANGISSVIRFGNNYCWPLSNFSYNFGQDPFLYAPILDDPTIQLGFGPRWKEEVKPITYSNNSSGILSWFNNDLKDYKFNQDRFDFQLIDYYKVDYKRLGEYYIKGQVTRIPDIANKRFVVRCISSKNNVEIAQCRISSDGIYEFLNLEYEPYILTSIDLDNNTVVESIGPIFPLVMT